MGPLGFLQAAVGLVLLAWLPGHLWRRLALPALRGGAGFAVDVSLSVAIMSATVYFANVLLGVPLAPATAVWLSLAVCAAGLAPGLAHALGRAYVSEE